MATIVVKTIGPSGDYTTLADWFAACPADLVASDIIYRGEVLNTELVGTGQLLNITGKTVDATHYVELTAAAGASFVDNTNVRTNALRYNAANGAAIRASSEYTNTVKATLPYTRVSRLQFKNSANSTSAYPVFYGTQPTVDVDQCIFEGGCGGYGEGAGAFGLGNGGRIRNSVVVQTYTGNPYGIARLDLSASAYNTTFVAIGGPANNAMYAEYGTSAIRNCYFGGANNLKSGDSTLNVTTSATSLTVSGWATVAMADAFESVTSGSHDLRLKSGSPLIDAGTVDTTYAANDVSGLTRLGSWDIGAWEYSSGGSTDATADGATLTATATLTPGSATGAVDGAASGATLTGSSSLIAGTAIGGASGTFVSSPMYSSGILQASVSMSWTWYPGVIGTAPTDALVQGSGATSAAGVLTASGLPTGAGFLLAETAAGAVYYEEGTVS